MFVHAYLKGLTHMVQSKADLERLRFMPQKIENGNLINFEGQVLVGGLDIKDTIIADFDRFATAKRYTVPLANDYFTALESVMSLFVNKVGSEKDSETETSFEEPYGADIYDAVAAGDKKALRKVLKQYKRTKWSALDEDDVEDAIDDIVDCIGENDAVPAAKEIVNNLIGDDICEVAKPNDKEKPIQKDPAVSVQETPADEDEAELLQDLADAVKDEDWDDVEMLLNELGKDHPRYVEFEKHLKPEAKEDTKPSDDNDNDNDDDIVDEILDDLEDALKKGDTSNQKEFLAELAKEIGEDDDLYKEYDVKVNPPKQERSRRSRRGN